jgi:flavin-dependent dehydrogenase
LSSQNWNVAVIGSGPAGCATALALERSGVSGVCIVDPNRSSSPPVGETLPPETRLVLDELGLWHDFVREGHEVCLGSCSSWGSDAFGYNDFLLSPHGRGWHLDRPRFNAFLLRSAASCGIAVVSSTRLLDCRSDLQRRFRLYLKAQDGTTPTLTARFVVDATGARSAFARRVGARPVWLDRLTFVYGFFDAQAGTSASRLTMIEAAEDGWWYAAALPGHRLALAFATDPETVRERMLSVEDRWLARVLRTRYIAPRLDGCRFVRGSLAVRAAPSFLLDRVAGARWLAVGDAAAAYDPLSSQGIHKALADGLEAAGAIAAALASDTDIAPAYAAAIADGFEEYRLNRNYFYRLETRWARSSFWQRRLDRADLQRPTIARTTGEAA